MGIQGKLKDLNNNRTLSDEEVKLLKDKFNQISDWKDAAVAKFAEIDDLLNLARTKIINHENRIKELEK